MARRALVGLLAGPRPGEHGLALPPPHHRLLALLLAHDHPGGLAAVQPSHHAGALRHPPPPDALALTLAPLAFTLSPAQTPTLAVPAPPPAPVPVAIRSVPLALTLIAQVASRTDLDRSLSPLKPIRPTSIHGSRGEVLLSNESFSNEVSDDTNGSGTASPQLDARSPASRTIYKVDA